MNNNSFVRAICRILIASMLWLPLHAQADLIATTQAVTAAQAQAARAALSSKLETLGVAGEGARERVASLTDAEVLQLAREIDELPSGGTAWPLLLVVIFLIWRFGFSEQAKAEQKAREPAKDQKK
jgi:hypothetical protein